MDSSSCVHNFLDQHCLQTRMGLCRMKILKYLKVAAGLKFLNFKSNNFNSRSSYKFVCFKAFLKLKFLIGSTWGKPLT